MTVNTDYNLKKSLSVGSIHWFSNKVYSFYSNLNVIVGLEDPF